ncbi:hypothetical protein DTJ15_07035 [Parasaccharibacter sp. TMW 2.1891]|nr:hypothetical protein [Parasaccharibacter sp. TMW 2.1891]
MDHSSLLLFSAMMGRLKRGSPIPSRSCEAGPPVLAGAVAFFADEGRVHAVPAEGGACQKNETG